jgi:hypothetical protein
MNEKTAEKTSLEIIRFINVPPARVYDAWTDPEQLRQWFGPENVRTRNITADVRVGGKYRWDLTSPEGEEMSAFRERRLSSLGNGMTMRIGQRATASSQWSYSIGMVAPNCSSSTSNCPVRNRAIVTMRVGTAFSID